MIYWISAHQPILKSWLPAFPHEPVWFPSSEHTFPVAQAEVLFLLLSFVKGWLVSSLSWSLLITFSYFLINTFSFKSGL